MILVKCQVASLVLLPFVSDDSKGSTLHSFDDKGGNQLAGRDWNRQSDQLRADYDWWVIHLNIIQMAGVKHSLLDMHWGI